MTTIVEVPEQLLVVEKLIEEYRWARRRQDAPARLTYEALKAIAGDLRGRADAVRPIALTTLSSCVQTAQAANLRQGHMVRIAQELIRFWPTVRQALELYPEKLQ